MYVCNGSVGIMMHFLCADDEVRPRAFSRRGESQSQEGGKFVVYREGSG